MKKRLALPFVLFFAVLLALAFSGNPTPGKAASADAPLALVPPTVVVPIDSGGMFFFRWRINIPLATRGNWQPAVGSVATSFRGNLYVAIGTGQTVLEDDNFPIPCTVTGKINLLPLGGPVKFDGSQYLVCDLPSIIEKVHLLAANHANFTFTISDYEDFRDPITQNSTVNLQVRFQAMNVETGTIFHHQSMKLKRISGNKYQAEIYEDLSSDNFNTIYSTKYRNSSAISLGTPPTIQTIFFELAPWKMRWCVTTTSLCTFEERLQQNFAWSMKKEKIYIGTNNALGEKFKGSMGNLLIDPRTSQSTGGTTNPPPAPDSEIPDKSFTTRKPKIFGLLTRN